MQVLRIGNRNLQMVIQIEIESAEVESEGKDVACAFPLEVRTWTRPGQRAFRRGFQQPLEMSIFCVRSMMFSISMIERTFSVSALLLPDLDFAKVLSPRTAPDGNLIR